MPSRTSHQNPIPPIHEDFHWITDPSQRSHFSDFIERTRDITAGVGTCLQLIHASDLVREINREGDPEQQAAPAIGHADAARLFRLSMAATLLLLDAAQERLNQSQDA